LRIASHFVGPKLCPDLIDEGWRACQAANGMDQPDGMMDCRTLLVLNFGAFLVIGLTAT
jgi:hypothetical protein